MRTILATLALLLPLSASAQVLVETMPERAARCATMGPQLDAAERGVAERIAQEASVIAQARHGDASAATLYHVGNRALRDQLRAVERACEVAAPAVGERARQIADTLNASSLRALNAAADSGPLPPQP